MTTTTNLIAGAALGVALTTAAFVLIDHYYATPTYSKICSDVVALTLEYRDMERGFSSPESLEEAMTGSHQSRMTSEGRQKLFVEGYVECLSKSVMAGGHY